MKKDNRTLLTMEERLALAAGSQASSPEAAVKLVQRLFETHTVQVFCRNSDLELMYELIGGSIECLDDDLFHYGGFCRSFQLAMKEEFAGLPGPCRPVLGVSVSNAVVLLGLMLLDHAKGRQRDKELYHCMRMTLGQYLDALDTLVSRGSRPSGQRFQVWKNLFLKNHDRSTPVEDALADILRHYIAGWQVYDRLDHILRCMDNLSHYLEQEAVADMDRIFREAMREYIRDAGLEGVEVVEEDERLPNPHGHYLALAREYSGDVPDPGDGNTALGAVRSQIFLSERDYSPRAMEALCAQSPSPEFQALLEEQIDQEQLSLAMEEINTAVTDLFMLWVEPYLRMGK